MGFDSPYPLHSTKAPMYSTAVTGRDVFHKVTLNDDESLVIEIQDKVDGVSTLRRFEVAPENVWMFIASIKSAARVLDRRHTELPKDEDDDD